MSSALHRQYHDWGETLEQGTKLPTAPWAPQHKWLPTKPGVCSQCVCVCVCLFTTHCCVCALGWVKCRAQIQSMGRHTWPYLAILGNCSVGCGVKRHLQIWLKDEYETKLQNVKFYYWMIQIIVVLPAKFSTFRVSSPWCEHKYWISCLTGFSKWSAVSGCINSSGKKNRKYAVSVISINSVFWIFHSMMTHTNQDEDEGADFERKASNLDAKRKEEVN